MQNQPSRSNWNGMDFSTMEDTLFFIGLLNEFSNRLQTRGDVFFEEISWKQCFLLICLDLSPHPPTLRELADLMGSSHQNVKQMLLKLERRGYVQMQPDAADKRKQRIFMTPNARAFQEKYVGASQMFLQQLFAGVSREQLHSTVQTLLTLDKNIRKI